MRNGHSFGSSGAERLEGRAMLAVADISGGSLDLLAASDTGVLTTDDYTSNTTPQIRITVPANLAMTVGDRLEIIDTTFGNAVVGTANVVGGDIVGGVYAGGTKTVTVSVLSGGNPQLHNLRARHFDSLTSTAGSLAQSTPLLALSIDTATPSVASVAKPANGVYFAGDPLSFTVTFAENVTVDPTVTLAVRFGPASTGTVYQFPRTAATANSVTFSRTILPADVSDTDGITVLGLQTGALTFATDVAGNLLTTTPTLTGLGSTAGIFVQTNVASSATFEPIVPNPRVEPVALITITFRNALGNPVAIPLGTGSSQFGLDDLQLRRNGSVVAWPATATITRVDNPADPLYGARFQIRDIAGITSLPGSYRVTFSDLGIAQSGELNWTMSFATPSELTAAVTPLPAVGNFVRTTPVDSVRILFNNPVVNVDTTVFGAAIKQFALYRDGGIVPFPNTVKVSGSGAEYYVTGLAGLTNTSGAYDLIVLPEGDPTKSIQTLSGTPMIASTGAGWQFVNSNILSCTITAPSPIPATPLKATDAIEFTVKFSSVVNVNTAGGTPSIPISLATGGPATAVYVGGAGTDTLKFRYQVLLGHAAPNGIVVGSAIVLNGAGITDSAGQVPNLVFSPPANASSVIVDAVAPTVLAGGVTVPVAGVYSDTAAAPNNKLSFSVSFSEPVKVTGSPTLSFTLGGVTKQAALTAPSLAAATSANGTSTLSFEYSILASDSGSGVAATGIALAGGTIKDIAGNDATLTSPSFPTNSPNAAVNIVGIVANGVTVAAGTYKTGAFIPVTVQFSKSVNVSSPFNASIGLLIGGVSRTATYFSGTGTTTLTFRYQVAAGDNANGAGLDFSNTQVTLGGGTTVQDAGGTNALLSFSPPNVAGVIVDTQAPTVAGVTSPAVNAYKNGDKLTFAVTFNEIVNVTGAPKLNVTIGGTTRQVDLVSPSGTGTTTLNFEYPVVAGDSTIAGVTATGISLAGGTIKDAAGNDATLTSAQFPAASLAFAINRTGITTLSAPANKTYKAGDVLEFTATFSNSVNVTGAARIQFLLDTSGTPNPKNASYVSGNGTDTLKFRYTVVDGDLDANGITLAAASIDLPTGSSITTLGGTPVALDIPTPSNLNLVVVDGVAPAANSVINGPTPGTYVTGVVGQNALVFTVPFNDVVTVTGAPTLRFSLGSNIREATFSGPVGFTGTQLEFRYLVLPGDSATSVSIAASPIQLNGGAIRDGSGNNANVATIAAASFNGVIVNLTSVTTVALASPNDRFYRAGETILFTATFDAPVTATGSPMLSLSIGGNTRNANYRSGSGTNALTFAYTIVVSDLDTDGLHFASTAISGGSITNAGGVVLLSFVPPDISGIRVDAVAPVLALPTSVIVPAAGNYKAGDTLQFTVTFNESIRVTPEPGSGSVPRIALVVGSMTRYAEYVAGTETPTLVFDYVVANTDLDLNGIVVGTAISLNGARITDIAGNTGSLLISPPPTNAVIVDGIAPTITRFSVPATVLNGSYKAGHPIPIIATASKTVTAGSSIGIELDTGAVVVLTAVTQGTTLTGTYVVAPGENSLDLTVTAISDASVTDTVGNLLTNMAVPVGTNNIAGSRNIVIDTIVPTAPAVFSLVTTSQKPILSGTATLAVGETLSVTVSGCTYNVPVVDGLWSLNLASTLPVSGTFVDLTDGFHSVAATVTDAAGNATSDPTFAEIFVDTTPPAAPVVTPLTSKVTKPVISGTATLLAGDTLQVLVNGSTFSNVPVALNAWSLNLAIATPDSGTFAALTDGAYSVMATARDPLGNTSTGTATLTIDTVAPALPSITGNLPSGSRTNVATQTFSGIAEPRSNVTIRNGGTALGTTVTNAAGFWSIAPSTLPDGSYSLTASATDAAGNISAPFIGHSLTIDTIAPTTPTITGTLASGSRTNVAAHTFFGSAEPGSTVTVRNGGAVLGTTVTSGAGLWSITLNSLSDGAYSLTATATDATGNTSGPSSGYSLTIDTVPPTMPTITGTLASGSRTNVATQTFSGTAEPGSTVTIRNGGAVLGTAVTSGAGLWSVTLNSLNDGAYSLTSTATDATGNTSGPSSGYSLTIDTVAPSVAAFRSASPDGTYGIGQTISIIAEISESVQAGATMTVTLNTGAQVTLVAASAGTTLACTYVVQPGDKAGDLDVSQWSNASVIDLTGNRMPNGGVVSAAFSSPIRTLGASNSIAVDGGVAITGSTGFSKIASLVPDKKVTVTTIPITFTTPVSGFTLGSIRLLLNGRSVSIRGARLAGSGANYRLTLPTRATSAKGFYTLEINPGMIAATVNGSSMTDTQSLYWGKGKNVGFSSLKTVAPIRR